MATFREQLELLITGQSTSAVSALNKTGAATEGLTTKQKAMGAASSVASSALEGLGFSADAGGVALKSAAVAAGAVASVQLAKWAKGAADEAANLAGEVRNFQRASGASAEDASRWVAVLDDLQVSSEKGATAAFKLGKEVAAGGEHLAQYGIQVAKNKDGTTDLTGTLLNVADAYAATEDPAMRAAIASAAFGKAGKDLIPVLEQGRAGLKEFFAGAESGHQVFTQQQLNMFREYELALDDLGDTLRGFKLAVGGAVAPVITSISKSLTGALTAADDATASFGGLGETLRKGIDFTPIGSGMHFMASASALASGEFGDFGEELARSVPLVGGVIGLFDDAGEAEETFATKATAAKEAQRTLLDLAAQGKTGTKEYAQARRDAARAEAEVESATRKATDAMTDQATKTALRNEQLLTTSDLTLQYESKVLAVADAEAKVNEIRTEGQQPAETAEEYTRRLTQATLAEQAAVNDAIKAAIALAIQNAGPSASAHDKAAAAADAQAAAIIRLWHSTPETQRALQELGYTVVTLPDGKEIVIRADTGQAVGAIDAVTEALRAAQREYLAITGGNPRAYYPSASGAAMSAPASMATMADDGTVELVGSPAAQAAGLGALVPAIGALAAVSARRVQPIQLNVTVNTTGLGASAPEIQRAVVEAVRGYVHRNGRLEGIAR